MEKTPTKKDIIEQIIKELKRLGKDDLQIVLKELQIKAMLKKGIKPAANPPEGMEEPTMEEINRWKHESRTYVAPK